MLRGRDKLSVLAELDGARPSEGRVWALQRAHLDALGGVLDRLAGKPVVMVTGGEQGVEAVALGLAATAIAAGKRAALLECELARPRLAAALGLAAAPGLHEYLRGDAEAGQILQPLVPAGPQSRHAVGPLVCIAAGEPAAEPADLLGSEGYRHAVAKLAHAYDFLVLSGPWLDAPSDALAAVSAEADAALVCVPPARLTGRSGRSVRAAAARLSAPVAGAVLVGESA
jgi:Mrp family chromosome partitioning ATPase